MLRSSEADLGRRVEHWVVENLDPTAGPTTASVDDWGRRIVEGPVWQSARTPAAPAPRAKPARTASGWRWVRWSVRDGIAVVRVQRKELLKESEVRELAEEVLDLVEAGHRRIALDFGMVERLSSWVAPALVEIGKRCAREGDGMLKVFRLRPEVADVASLNPLPEILGIVPDEASALTGPWPEHGGPRPLPDAVVQALKSGRASDKVQRNAKVRTKGEPTRPRLVVASGQKHGRGVTIDEEGVVLGRERGCRVRVGQEQVSRRHARIRWADGGIRLRDLGSANGTFLNGRRLGPAEVEVRPGDWIEVGPAAFMVVWPANGEDGPRGRPGEKEILDWLGVSEAIDPDAATWETLVAATPESLATHSATLRWEVVADVLVITPLESQLVDDLTLVPLRADVEGLLEHPNQPRRVVLNLEHVTRIGTATLGLFAAWAFRLDREGGGLRITQTNPRVALVLEQVRLAEIVDVHATLDEAVLTAWDREPTSGANSRA